MPAVSVLMPCYNASQWVDEALESLARQTLSDIEIVCVDDGSSDDTRLHLGRWAARDRRVRVAVQPHAGVIAASNNGLQSCTAPYVARLDADDRAHPERLERQAAFLDAHPEVGVVSSLVTGFPASQVRQGFAIYLEWLNGLVSHEQICREIFVESPLPNPSVMYRRDLVMEIGAYQERGWPEEYIHAAVSHGWGLVTDEEPTTVLEKTLYATEELTGLITAAALVRPSKSVADMEAKSVMKKWKDKSFAAGVNRPVIEKGAEMLGVPLQDLVSDAILGMREVREKIGL